MAQKHWENLIKELGLDESRLSKSITSLIADYRGMVTTIATINASLADPAITEVDRQELSKDLKDANTELNTLNDSIISKIEFGQKMANSRKGKNQDAAQQATSGSAPATTVPIPAPATELNDIKKVEPVVVDPPAGASQAGDPEKKDSTGAWILGIGLAVIGSVLGINWWNNRNG